MSDEEDAPGTYNNAHRAFLQSLLSRQTITYEQAKPILAAIESAQRPERPTLPNDISPDDFDDYITLINDRISPFDYEVRSTLHQVTRERIYALVNTTSDALTQLATVHTPDEIAFVKRVIDAMFDTNNTPQAEVFAVKSTAALKLSRPRAERRDSGTQTQTQGRAPAAALTQTEAEKVLTSMVDEGWFELSTHGYYSLSERGLMELRNWLIETYNEDSEEEDEDEQPRVRIKKCAMCQQIVTVGLRCPNRPCNIRTHEQCTKLMFRQQNGQQQCKDCKTGWADPLPVGEKAARNANAARPASGENGRRSTNGRSMMNDDQVESDAEGGSED